MTTPDAQKSITHIVSKLNGAISNVRMYFKDHPEAVHHIDYLYEEVLRGLKATSAITIIAVGDKLIWQNKPLKIDAGITRQMLQVLSEKGIEHFSFTRGISRKEIDYFVTALSEKKSIPVKSSPGIKIGKISLEKYDTKLDLFEEVSHYDDEDSKFFQELHSSVLEIKDVYQTIKKKKGLNFLILGDIVSAFIDAFHRGHNPIKLLSMIRSADEYTFTHVVNVCILTMSQAEYIGLKGEILFQIGVASLLHDVGKLFIPDHILKKPGALTSDERSVINGHVVKGALYILNMTGIPRLAVLGALEHHIKYDGSGYPQMEKGYQPNIASQLIAIADTYDAMRSKRPYQSPRDREEIFDVLIKEKGISFNPQLVDNFVRLMQTD